jgi:hypothetical protein
MDNLPFRLFVFDGAWMEAFVAQTPDGAFVEVLHKPTDVPAVYRKLQRLVRARQFRMLLVRGSIMHCR